MAAGRELYIYWKVSGADAPAACAAAAAVQAALRAADAMLVTRLFRRAEEQDTQDRTGQVTVMETYARPGRGLDDDAIASITTATAARLAGWTPRGRHVEVFEEVLPA